MNWQTLQNGFVRTYKKFVAVTEMRHRTWIQEEREVGWSFFRKNG